MFRIPKNISCILSPFGVATLVVMSLGTATFAQAPPPSTDAVLFDNVTDPNSPTNANLPISSFKFINEQPRTMIGAKINLGLAQPNLVQATQLQLGLAHLPTTLTSVQYSRIQLQAKFYDDGSAAPSTDVFNTPIGDTLTFEVFDAIKGASPAQTAGDFLLPNHGYFFRVNLPESVKFADPFHVGIAFRFLGDRVDDANGTGLQVSEDLSFVMRQGAPFKVGSSDFLTPSLGYLRDGADGLPQRGDFNFDQSDGATLRDPNTLEPYANVGVAMRLYGVVIPEANTVALLGISLPCLIGMVTLRRRL